ncbi:Uncharacterised protein [Propionibacterium australiense]|uniref:Uncharacterized protein n=1 Tax=Propionibacterium australiense TaxID=119981 RepID=A0A383SA48_9ACTN|nr:Hypothetical protein PROPAUS_2631 [Propionibacterium australiense]VEH92514.1 Uncharacterised protein [Propionibacterium australiense]
MIVDPEMPWFPVRIIRTFDPDTIIQNQREISQIHSKIRHHLNYHTTHQTTKRSLRPLKQINGQRIIKQKLTLGINDTYAAPCMKVPVGATEKQHLILHESTLNQ